MSRAVPVCLMLGLAACSSQVNMPQLKAGGGLEEDAGTIAVDPSEVPVLPHCEAGQLVGKGSNGWECFTPAQPAVLQGGQGIAIDGGVISFNASTVATSAVWPGTIPYSQVTDAPTPYTDEQAAAVAQTVVTWSTLKGSVHQDDVWPGSVSYQDVMGAPSVDWATVSNTVGSMTPWPGTVPYAEVTGAPSVSWATVTNTVGSMTQWPGTVPYSEVTGAPAVDWATVSNTVGSMTPWPGKVPYSEVTGAPSVDWATVSNTVGSMTPWPGTVPYSEVTGAPSVDWATVSNTMGSTTQWPGTVPYSQVTNAPADLGALANTVATLQTQLTNLESRVTTDEGTISTLQAQLTTIQQGLCPSGYAINTSTLPATMTLCTKTLADGSVDQIVKVSDFWIDRFEMSTCDGGSLGDATGSGATATACSVSGVLPTGDIDWYQAAQLCANAGKELCSNEEWQTSAMGTNDPGTSDGTGGLCVTSGSLRQTGLGTSCRSRFGAEDMVGNVSEWVADWSVAGPAYTTSDGQVVQWPVAFGQDGVFNVDSTVYQSGAWQQGMPGAMIRGGKYNDQGFAGNFMLDLNHGPTHAQVELGARCCLGR